MKRILAYFLPVLLLLASWSLHAVVPEPDQWLDQATKQLMQRIGEQKLEIKQKPETLLQLAQTELLPHFDIELMARYVLAVHARRISAEQFNQFVNAFSEQVMRFYIRALLDDPNRIDSLIQMGDKLIVYRANPGAALQTKVVVKSVVTLPDGRQIPVDFRVYRKELTSEQWQIYDVIVEGISLLTNYRTSYGAELSRDGFDNTLARLLENNKQILETIQSGGTIGSN